MRLKKLLVLFVIIISSMVIFHCESYAYNYLRCGENISFTVENGVLTITGTGEMYDYLEVYGEGYFDIEGYGISGHGRSDGKEYYYRNIPWSTGEESNESERIYKIIVEEGITYIGANSFHDMLYVSDVYLPSTLKIIGSGAFYGCRSLKSVEFPSSLNSLGVEGTENTFAMFEYCSSLEEIIIPEDSELKYIEPGAFYESGTFAGLEIYIPEKVEEIGWAALDGMFSNIEVAENNRIYCSKDGVLYSKDMSTLISYPMLKKSESFIVPDTVTKIEARALHVFGVAYFDSSTHQSTKTVKLYIPDSVEEMGEDALRTEMNIEVYFAGTESEWNRYVDNGSIVITSDNVHFDYSENSAVKIVVIAIGSTGVLSLMSVVIKRKKH